MGSDKERGGGRRGKLQKAGQRKSKRGGGLPPKRPPLRNRTEEDNMGHSKRQLTQQGPQRSSRQEIFG